MHCFHTSQDGGFGAGSPRKGCPRPRLSWTPRSYDASMQRQGCAKDSSAWGETQTLNRSHPKQAGQITNMIQGRSLGCQLLPCVSCAFCCCRSKDNGRGEESWIWGFLIPRRKYNDRTPEEHALVKGCSGANVGCSPGRGLEEIGFISGRKI